MFPRSSSVSRTSSVSRSNPFRDVIGDGTGTPCAASALSRRVDASRFAKRSVARDHFTTSPPRSLATHAIAFWSLIAIREHSRALNPQVCSSTAETQWVAAPKLLNPNRSSRAASGSTDSQSMDNPSGNMLSDSSAVEDI